MYKLLLISKYLRKRRIAWVSLVAVCLCTAMVLVVLSVMGGWLRMFRTQFQGLSGQVIVRSSIKGFAGYDEMIKRIEALPGVLTAAPMIQSFGLINIDGQKVEGVQIIGLDVDKIGKINKFPQSLFRQYQQPIADAKDPKSELTPEEREKARDLAARTTTRPSFALPFPADVYRNRLPRKSPNAPDPALRDGIILGSGLLDIHKDKDGKVVGRDNWKYLLPVNLTVLSLTERGTLDASSPPTLHNYWIVDDSRTGVWQYDSNTAYVPFESLQRDMLMSATNDEPARTTEIHVALKPGVDMNAIKPEIQKIVDKVWEELGKSPIIDPTPQAKTWEETMSKYLSAIENEVALVTTLFSFISIVAVFLIFCIFYMIVAEKTKDIGIIKSVGATSGGVAGIFIGYGAAIGVVGGLFGLALGWVIVHNINGLHAAMAKFLGIQIWNPEVYVFDTIPNTVDPKAATIIVLVAIVSSVIGAIVPAIRAARLNPVEALRFE